MFTPPLLFFNYHISDFNVICYLCVSWSGKTETKWELSVTMPFYLAPDHQVPFQAILREFSINSCFLRPHIEGGNQFWQPKITNVYIKKHVLTSLRVQSPYTLDYLRVTSNYKFPFWNIKNKCILVQVCVLLSILQQRLSTLSVCSFATCLTSGFIQVLNVNKVYCWSKQRYLRSGSGKARTCNQQAF